MDMYPLESMVPFDHFFVPAKEDERQYFLSNVRNAVEENDPDTVAILLRSLGCASTLRAAENGAQLLEKAIALVNNDEAVGWSALLWLAACTPYATNNAQVMALIHERALRVAGEHSRFVADVAKLDMAACISNAGNPSLAHDMCVEIVKYYAEPYEMQGRQEEALLLKAHFGMVMHAARADRMLAEEQLEHYIMLSRAGMDIGQSDVVSAAMYALGEYISKTSFSEYAHAFFRSAYLVADQCGYFASHGARALARLNEIKDAQQLQDLPN